MAAPQDAPEQAYRLRKFQGTGTEIDSTFLGPSFVAQSQNWIPTQSYRLGKRPGTLLLGHAGEYVTQITHLNACHAPDGTPHLFAYVQKSGGGGQINESINEGAINPTPGAPLFPSSAPGRTILFRDRVYAGNGVDPIISWLITDTDPTKAQVYKAIPILGAPAATVPQPGDTTTGQVDHIDNPANQLSLAIPSGDYSWCWAIFDPNSGLYIARGEARIVHVGSGASNTGQQLLATPPAADPNAAGPAGAWPAGTKRVYRVFVTPRNYPMEYGTAQGVDFSGANGAARTINTIDVTDLRVPLFGGTGLFRTGDKFLIWQNRLVFTGMANDLYSVFATETILPGVEQDLYNEGTIFPVFAKVVLPHKVTGIGTAGVTTDQSAQAPLLFFTEAQTFLIQGDPFLTDIELEAGATPATMEEISSRVGCISHDTIVNTPVGTIWVGIDSIYLIPPGGGYPQDIGWPIANQIRAIPVSQRPHLCACFHKQFYKLAFVPTSGVGNSAQWWLDLRQGLSGVPSWWGPHVLGQNPNVGKPGYPVSAMCADPSSPFEVDRGYLAVMGTDQILVHHQLGIFTDYDPTMPNGIGINSVLLTGRFDNEQPFIAKVMTRLRVIGQTAAKSLMGVTVIIDNGKSVKLDDVILGEDMESAGEFVPQVPFPDPPYPPDNQQFNHLVAGGGKAMFGTISPSEAQTIAPYGRPRFLSIQAVLTHGPRPEDDPKVKVPSVELRDFELLFIPSQRKVRFTSDTRSPQQFGPERVSR